MRLFIKITILLMAFFLSSTVYATETFAAIIAQQSETPEVAPPTFEGYIMDGISGYGMYIYETTPGSSIMYRVFAFNPETDAYDIPVTDGWQEYEGTEGEIYYTNVGSKYRVEAYAYIGDVQSEVIGYEFIVPVPPEGPSDGSICDDYDFAVDGIYYNAYGNHAAVSYIHLDIDEHDHSLEVISDYSGDVIIPSTVTYNGRTYAVTSIEEYAFYYCEGLSSITIPSSVTEIGRYAFEGCNLISVNITDMTSWCNISYEYSPSFTSGYYLYLNGIEVTELTIPSSVTSIGSYAFCGCNSLASVIIPSSVTEIGGSAFSYCNRLRRVTCLSTTPPSIDYAFSSGTYSGILYIPLGCKNIYNSAYYWNNFSKIEELNDDFKIDGIYYTVNGNETTVIYVPYDLVNVIIPSSITSKGTTYSVISISDYAFYHCSFLTSVTIPNSVTSIGSYAFSGCSGLTSVAIPNSVTSIGSYAFSGCSGLTSVAIPNSVTSIGSYAFCGCSGLTSVAIPNSVTAIESNTFYNCSGLTSVTIPNSVTSIGSNAFCGCSCLTSVVIPNSVIAIDSNAFNNCNGLNNLAWNARNCSTNGNMTTSNIEQVTIGDEVEVLPSNFVNSSKITSVTIPNSVTSISNNAFYGCSRLTSVTIPMPVTAIGSNAFYNCSGLTNIVWNARNCSTNGNMTTSNIEQVTIGNKVTVLPSNFVNGSKITSVTIPNSVTTIGDNAFKNCAGLISIDIPNSVTSISNNAFFGCRELRSVTLGGSVTSIGKQAFMNDAVIETVTCMATTPPAWDGLDLFTTNVYNHTPLVVPNGCARAYMRDQCWGQFAKIVCPGDMNMDGTVTISDVTTLINSLLSGSNTSPTADTNIDGKVTISDVTTLINYLLSGEWPSVETDDHEWVDLGLPSGTLWATCNVGASSPEEFGDYFAWGETTPRDFYDWSAYNWSTGSSTTMTKYCTSSSYGYEGFTDSKTELDLEDDAAYVNWGKKWRMPTYEQYTELHTQCTWTWTTQNGVKGYLVTGSNGNTMFVPAAGYYSDRTHYSAGTEGRYWLSTLYSDRADHSYCLFFNSGSVSWDDSRRYRGFSVRAVRASHN